MGASTGSIAGNVYMPCRCGGKLPRECGLMECNHPEGRLGRLAKLNGLEPDELRAWLADEIHRRTQSD